MDVVNSDRQMRSSTERNPPDSLEQALAKCRSAARHGYEIAKENLRESGKAIGGVSKSLSNCLKSIENGFVRTPGIIDQLKTQLSAVMSELEQLQRTSESALEERRKRFDTFSVTLFGRTMTGKSTLMEIVTKGNGHSIGTGAQRKTRDVRSYPWKGLEVTDVPGVAAFEGSEDEELAFKAASQADLVLFLITDDAPQPVEAECLARVRSLGKPVLGVCNVKKGIGGDEDDLKLFLRNPENPFDRSRLSEIIDTLHELVPGPRVPFLATALLAQARAQGCDLEQFFVHHPHLVALRRKLAVASCFDVVEEEIIEEVVGRGSFLRVKSFIDGAVTPMMDLTDLLLKFSTQNSSSGRVLIDKRRQLRKWSKEFGEDGQERINTLVSRAMDTLRDEVSTFAEDHYEDNAAGESWKQLVESTGINEKVEKLQKELCDECKKALNEVARELKSELSLVASVAADRHIKMDSIFNLKRAWNWGTTILSGGLTLAAIILGSSPLGWAAAAVGGIGWLVSWFFDDREEKARRAREKLTKRLLDNIDKMERILRKKLGDWLYQELLGKQVYVLLDDLRAVTKGLFALADSQRNLAWTLNDRQKALGRTLIDEALLQLRAESLKSGILDVARVPGLATMFLIAPNTTFPGDIRDGLERLLSEQIWFVVDTKVEKSILAQAIGRDCERNRIGIEKEIRIAHVPLDHLGSIALARVRLAQQLTGLHVMR